MSNKIIEDLYYSKNDEWIKIENGVGTIGITEYAQDQLGDIVYIENIKKDEVISKGDVLTTVESVKAVSDVYSPLSGKIVEINQQIIDEPSIVNQDPYGRGWFARIKMDNSEEIDELMNASEYSDYRKE